MSAVFLILWKPKTITVGTGPASKAPPLRILISQDEITPEMNFAAASDLPSVKISTASGMDRQFIDVLNWGEYAEWFKVIQQSRG